MVFTAKRDLGVEGERDIPRFVQRGQGKTRLSSLSAQNRSPFCPSHSGAVLSGSLAPEGSSLHNAHSAVVITAVDCEPIPHFSAATAFSTRDGKFLEGRAMPFP